MYTTINKNDFINAFRAIRPDNFSYEGLCELYNHFMQYEADTGEQLELDVIAICCGFTEQTVDEVIADYSLQVGDDEDAAEVAKDYLSYNSVLVGETQDGSLVYMNF